MNGIAGPRQSLPRTRQNKRGIATVVILYDIHNGNWHGEQFVVEFVLHEELGKRTFGSLYRRTKLKIGRAGRSPRTEIRSRSHDAGRGWITARAAFYDTSRLEG
jgi:hypothetical protein